jgi:hypothetical protein
MGVISIKMRRVHLNYSQEYEKMRKWEVCFSYNQFLNFLWNTALAFPFLRRIISLIIKTRSIDSDGEMKPPKVCDVIPTHGNNAASTNNKSKRPSPGAPIERPKIQRK